MKELTGPAMMKRKARFEKCKESFPDRAEFYQSQIDDLLAGLLAIGACQRCGRPLKGEESQARGYGPECLKKVEEEEEKLQNAQ